MGPVVAVDLTVEIAEREMQIGPMDHFLRHSKDRSYLVCLDW